MPKKYSVSLINSWSQDVRLQIRQVETNGHH